MFFDDSGVFMVFVGGLGFSRGLVVARTGCYSQKTLKTLRGYCESVKRLATILYPWVILSICLVKLAYGEAKFAITHI